MNSFEADSFFSPISKQFHIVRTDSVSNNDSVVQCLSRMQTCMYVVENESLFGQELVY